MLKYYFSDIGDARFAIELFNESIDKYGHIDLGFVKTFMMCSGEPSYVDYQVGWTERFMEERDVKPRLRGTRWTFEFTMPEPKEL